IVQVEGEDEVAPAVVGEAGQEIWFICRFAHRAYGGVHSDGRSLIRARVADGCTRDAEVRLGSLQRLVRSIHLDLQSIELRVLVEAPPVPFELLVARLSGLP